MHHCSEPSAVKNSLSNSAPMIVPIYYWNGILRYQLKWNTSISVDFSILFKVIIIIIIIHILTMTHLFRTCDKTFYFFWVYTFYSWQFFLFFILRKSCVSTWLLIWERNVEVEKKNNLVVIENSMFVEKRRSFFSNFFFNKKLW